MPKITVEDFDHIIRDDLPWAYEIGMHTDYVKRGSAALRLPFRESMLRPGGVVSGPTIMALADACMYAVVLSLVGKLKLTVTSNFSIYFLHPAAPVDLLAEGRMIKLGRRLAVMEVTVHSEGKTTPVAHATGTYSIPPTAG
ncbi:MAG: PaaI family thioesterase [Rhodospirillales bacterium]